MQKKEFRLLLLCTLAVMSISLFAHEMPNSTPIFENLYIQPDKKLSDFLKSWTGDKEKLHSLARIHFSDAVQIDFNRMKYEPYSLQQNEIIDINSHLAPKAASVAATKGYGIQMKMRID